MTDPSDHDAANEIDAATASVTEPRSRSPRRPRMIGAAVAVLIAVLIATSALLWARSRHLDDQVVGMRHQVTQMRDSVTTFKKCVNTYMRTVGAWSSDVSNGYRYRYC